MLHLFSVVVVIFLAFFSLYVNMCSLYLCICIICLFCVAIVLSTYIVQLAAPINSNVRVELVYQTLTDAMVLKIVQTVLMNRIAVSVAFKCAYLIIFILKHLTLII